MLPALNLGLRANFCDIFYQNSFCIRSRSTMSHMASLADLPEVIGFFSYSRDDDESYKGRLSALREAIHQELSAQLGRSKKAFRLWQDREAIAPGKLWELEITNAVEQSVFFIPIVTPRAVNSDYCKFEFEFVSNARARAWSRGPGVSNPVRPGPGIGRRGTVARSSRAIGHCQAAICRLADIPLCRRSHADHAGRDRALCF